MFNSIKYTLIRTTSIIYRSLYDLKKKYFMLSDGNANQLIILFIFRTIFMKIRGTGWHKY